MASTGFTRSDVLAIATGLNLESADELRYAVVVCLTFCLPYVLRSNLCR